MAGLFTMPRLFTPHSSNGYSLVELLVGLAVALAVTGSALTLALSSRSLYDRDQSRVHVNQSIRGAKDFLASDLRQAGERLGDDVFAIEIVDGVAGAPDQLIVRRSLIDTVLRVCFDVSVPSQVWVLLAIPPTSPFAPAPPGCTPSPDVDADGWPDDIQIFRDRRIAQGELRAYIYDPVRKVGEFFDWEREIDASTGVLVLRPAGSPPWTASNLPYSPSSQSRLYVLEERRYELVDGNLQMVINGDGEVIHLVDGITDFQARVVFTDGSRQQALGPVNGDDWSDIWRRMRSIEVSLSAEADHRGKTIARTFSSEILPRNVLSR